MEMENDGLECDTVTRPTNLLITCTNTETRPGESDLEDAAQQQVSTLTEQYHFIDQNGHGIRYEIQAVSGTSPRMMILTNECDNGQVYHVIPSPQSGTAQLLIPQGIEPVEHNQPSDNRETGTDSAAPENTSSVIIHSNTSLAVSKKSPTRWSVEQFQKPLQPLPPNIPVWARRLRNCEKLRYCKVQTFVLIANSIGNLSVLLVGSRAIVMECQYGPRRKGAQPKKGSESDNISGQLYKATCPARIYIKKVKKFPNYRVPTDPKIDKKLIKMEQEKAFNLLKKDLDGIEGVLRWYVQLPDQEAHQYHSLDGSCFSPSPAPFQPVTEEEEEMLCDEGSGQLSRLHPCVADKIRELVSGGMEEVYAVRKQLRKFVERELFKLDEIPERHNLSYFPTVNDLKNHIHEAQKALGNAELIYDQEAIPGAVREV
ncbi:calcium-responsive transcription factor [Pseudophryne corroboree]|uniref:calcium-responsive transcription factor n=1 Tax=Pseudophryne corroboree TaxID=495146 RepID=UPI0030814D49